MHCGVPSVSLFQNDVFPWCAAANIKFALKVVTSVEDSNKNAENGKYENINGFRFKYENINEVRFEENMLLLLLLLLLRVYVCCVLYGSHAEGVNRRHRGALCSAYVGRAVRCACGSITRPRAQVTVRLLFR